MSSWINSEQERFKPLGAIESVERAVGVFMHGFFVFLPIGFTMLALPILLIVVFLVALVHKIAATTEGGSTTTVTTTTPPSYGQYGGNQNDEQLDTSGILVAIILAAILVFFLAAAVMMVGMGATIRATAEIYAGKRPSLVNCLKEGFNRFCHLFLLGWIIFAATLGIGFVVAITVGIVNVVVALATGSQSAVAFVMIVEMACLADLALVYVYVALSFHFMPPSIVLEKKSSYASIGRSWELIDKRRLPVIGAFFLVAVTNIIVKVTLQKLMDPSIALFITLAWDTVMVQFGSILGTVLFLSVRVDKEGLNREVLLRDLGYDYDDEHITLPTLSVGPGEYKPVLLAEKHPEAEVEIV